MVKKGFITSFPGHQDKELVSDMIMPFSERLNSEVSLS
jgi:hypothetical protein